ncbi:MAG: DUF423 domain-containing protein [Coraliomargaritaceae bacterium]
MRIKSGFVLAGALYGFIGVSLGAFGAHALHQALELREATAIWKTAVQYQMWHALALLLLALLHQEERPLTLAGIFFIFGTAIFSGTLYGIGLGGPRWLGAITPLGGLSLLAGWLQLAQSALRQRLQSSH